jgi:hypothetical protein
MKFQEISDKSFVVRKQNVLFSNLDDEFLGIDSQAGYVYSMNQTANRIWDLLSSPILVQRLCLQMSGEYSVDMNVCQEEILSLLRKLLAADLIQVNNDDNETRST